MELDTFMRIYSMTKVITGVAVLQLFEQGRFRLSDSITNWISELATPMVCMGGSPENPKLEPARTNITVSEFRVI
jgi:CubicO group peptidase (beta-lactamase class C family)